MEFYSKEIISLRKMTNKLHKKAQLIFHTNEVEEDSVEFLDQLRKLQYTLNLCESQTVLILE